jgi:AcrR family transcriptional regulator
VTAVVASSAGSRGRPRSARADRAIAEAAIELVGEVGYADLTMAGVAERAGVSTATLYRRFSSKEDLVIGALTTLVPPGPPVDTGSLEADLRERLDRLVAALGGDTGRLLRGLAGEAARHPALREAARTRLTEPLRDALLLMLDRAVARGEIPAPVAPDLALSVILGPLHYRRVITDEPVDAGMVDELVRMLLRALGARTGD